MLTIELSKFSFNFNLYWTVAVSPLASSGIVQVIELFDLSTVADIVPIFASDTYAKSKLLIISAGK